jgi:F-box-like
VCSFFERIIAVLRVAREARSMSLSRHKPTNQLNEDVLLVIFDQLDDQDLIHCETVCRHWRNVLLSGRPWRTLFHRKIVSSPQWRQVWRDFGVDERNLDAVHYRRICMAIIREWNEIYRNWRKGKFYATSKSVQYANRSHVTIGNDLIALIFYHYRIDEKEFEFLHRKSLEVISSMEITDRSFVVTNTEIVVAWDEKNIKILDTDGQLISRVPELDELELISWNLASCCLSGDQMAVISQIDGPFPVEKLSLWDVSDPLRATCLKSRYYNFDLQLEHSSLIKLDEQFIVVSTFQDDSTTIYFFSKETLDLHWQKTVDGNMRSNFVYDQGMLLLYVKQRRKSGKFGLIEMYDVKSGHCFRKLRTPVKHDVVEPLDNFVGFNSKFMVVVHTFFYNSAKKYKMDVYDLEAVKNPKADEILVRTLIVKFHFEYFMVTESEIFCVNVGNIHRLNFSSFEPFRNAAKCVTLSSPWRSVWRSKGVDDEPLEPVRHMEVYREVLNYFEELSMNCRTAIKICSTFSNALNCRDIPKLKYDIHDDWDDMVFDARGVRAFGINQTTCVSVMDNIIKLTDSKTDKIINEVKLERDVLIWHVNSNLLVFVSVIADHEHLLSVWRIENSVNLNHIKDVIIGDYEGSLQVDEQFIAIKTDGSENAETKTYNFISMKTFQVERSVSPIAVYSDYDKGYLFLLEDEHLVRILEVASGTFLRDICMEPSCMPLKICTINSNYVVLLTGNGYHSMLYVYDLNSLKENNVVPTHFLLTSMEIQFQVKKMGMNENKIVCVGYLKDCVIDLKPIDRLRCPELY